MFKGLRLLSYQFSSVQFIRSVMSDYLRPHGLQHAKPPCLSLTPRVYSNPCPQISSGKTEEQLIGSSWGSNTVQRIRLWDSENLCGPGCGPPGTEMNEILALKSLAVWWYLFINEDHVPCHSPFDHVHNTQRRDAGKAETKKAILESNS